MTRKARFTAAGGRDQGGYHQCGGSGSESFPGRSFSISYEDATSAPQEVAAAPEGNGVSFQAESFSIYVVTKDLTIRRLIIFMRKREQSLLIPRFFPHEENLNRPETPENTQNQKFIGWFYENGK